MIFPKVSIRTDESGHYGTKIREGGLLAHTPPILRGAGLKIAGKISLGAVRLTLRWLPGLVRRSPNRSLY